MSNERTVYDFDIAVWVLITIFNGFYTGTRNRFRKRRSQQLVTKMDMNE